MKQTFAIKSKFPSMIVGAIAAIGLSVAMLGAGNLESAEQAQVGQPAPDFTLTDLDGVEHTLSDYTSKGQTVVLEWFSPSCPFVKKHYRDDTMTMNTIIKDIADESVVWLRMNSARAGHPAAALKLNKQIVKKWDITTPILMDPEGTVGRTYKAKRTPEMYIINAQGVLVYHGAIDDRADAQAPGETNYVRNGLNEVIAGDSITKSTTKAYGCSIKY